MPTNVLVLGAGFGGLELSSRWSSELGDAVDVTLIDQSDAFVFGFAKLDVLLGRRSGRGADALQEHRETGGDVSSRDDHVDRPRRSHRRHRHRVVLA